jgi:hypothetical protein
MKLLTFPEKLDDESSPEEAFQQARDAKLKRVIILGYDEDNYMYFTSTKFTGAQALWLVEEFKNSLLNGR